MATPWTIPKLVTWRAKNWASCFLACKFTLENENRPNNNSSNNSNNDITENIIAYKKNKKKMRGNQRERKLSLSPPTASTRRLTNDKRSSSVSPAQNRRLSWPPVSDEGFIVFCFDRDGGFDLVTEEKPERTENGRCPEKSPRTVNRKLTYGDQEGRTEEKNMPENWTEQERNDNASCPRNEDVSSDVLKEEEESDYINASGGSSGSDQSDGGRGSFAFPILGMEWMGSPVQMPKSDDLCLKKQKQVSLGFPCCRF